MNELRERLAGLEHDRWSRWMRYMLRCGTFTADDEWIMPADKVKRWTYQMVTAYCNLSESEKDNDREEADSTLAVIESGVMVLVRERDKARELAGKYYVTVQNLNKMLDEAGITGTSGWVVLRRDECQKLKRRGCRMCS